ncbi:MAG: hypothetical protein WBO32_11465 [Cyclobacteriaceae bacterium]
MRNLIWAAFALSLYSCMVSVPAEPETEVRVSLDESVAIEIIKDSGTRFISLYSEEDYRKAFLDYLKSSMNERKLVIDNTNPEFSIAITKLELTEISTLDTVKDERSPDNGRVFDIAIANGKVSGTITNLATQKTETWTADRDKKERLTSFQSPAQIIKGENKDLNEYRKKDFDKNEFVSIAAQCGQQAAKEVGNSVRRQLK